MSILNKWAIFLEYLVKIRWLVKDDRPVLTKYVTLYIK